MLRCAAAQLPEIRHERVAWRGPLAAHAAHRLRHELGRSLTEKDGSLAYPDLLRGLIDRQQPDGGWGNRVDHGHDRLLTTLAVVLLLARIGHRRHDKELRAAGERVIWKEARELDHDGQATVVSSSYYLTPRAGQSGGPNLPYAHLRHYEVARATKLSLLPKNHIFESRTTALFSLEAFTDNFDLNGAARLLQPDGSMANSPSATAALLGQVGDWRVRFPRSTAYLEDLLWNYESGLPAMAPCGIFTRAWVLHYLQYGGLLSGQEVCCARTTGTCSSTWATTGSVSPHVFRTRMTPP